MALLARQAQAGNTWRLRAGGASIGRVWQGAHILRILRDSDLAEAIAAIPDNATNAQRRTAARAAIQAWRDAGGHDIDLSGFSHSLLNPSGIEDGNRYLLMNGVYFGYLHGVNNARDRRLLRWIKLAEDLFSGENLGTTNARNQALDAAIASFKDDGALD
jgi:hypothetical protein